MKIIDFSTLSMDVMDNALKDVVHESLDPEESIMIVGDPTVTGRIVNLLMNAFGIPQHHRQHGMASFTYLNRMVYIVGTGNPFLKDGTKVFICIVKAILQEPIYVIDKTKEEK